MKNDPKKLEFEGKIKFIYSWKKKSLLNSNSGPVNLRTFAITTSYATLWYPRSLVDNALAYQRCDPNSILLIDSGCMWQGMAVPRFNTRVLSGYSSFLPHQWPPGIYWFELAYAYNNITKHFQKVHVSLFFSFFLEF